MSAASSPGTLGTNQRHLSAGHYDKHQFPYHYEQLRNSFQFAARASETATMRFAAGIVASAGLAALATASSAAIYELNTPATSGPALDVSPEQARLGISLALGVSRFYKLGAQDSSDKQVEVLERFGRLENRIGLTPNDEGRFVLSLAGIGMEDADGMSKDVGEVRDRALTD